MDVAVEIGMRKLFTPPRTDWAVADILLVTGGVFLEGLFVHVDCWFRVVLYIFRFGKTDAFSL